MGGPVSSLYDFTIFIGCRHPSATTRDSFPLSQAGMSYEHRWPIVSEGAQDDVQIELNTNRMCYTALNNDYLFPCAGMNVQPSCTLLARRGLLVGPKQPQHYRYWMRGEAESPCYSKNITHVDTNEEPCPFVVAPLTSDFTQSDSKFAWQLHSTPGRSRCQYGFRITLIRTNSLEISSSIRSELDRRKSLIYDNFHLIVVDSLSSIPRIIRKSRMKHGGKPAGVHPKSGGVSP